MAAAAIAAPPTTAPTTTPVVPPPNYDAAQQVAHVPFANKVDYAKLGGMYVRVSFDGEPPLTLQVDTGSVGVIVGAVDLPHVDPNAPKGSITYVSSGNELDGVWTPVTITFVDAVSPDGKPVTATLPVLAAQSYQFHPGAVNGGRATTKPAAKRPAATTKVAGPAKPPRPRMFGVGWARGSDSHPERNPFINLTAMQAGTMRRGYTITRDGFDLGLSPANVGPGYVFEKLAPRPVSAETAALRPGLHDWADPRGSVTVGRGEPIDVGILMDTGLTNFMIELPTVPANADVAAGTPVSVGLVGGRLGYHFTAGDKADPSAPRRVTWTPRQQNALVNTGLKSLSGFDYLFDADGGYFALRPTNPGR